jgi:hypothetical protein
MWFYDDSSNEGISNEDISKNQITSIYWMKKYQTKISQNGDISNAKNLEIL